MMTKYMKQWILDIAHYAEQDRTEIPEREEITKSYSCPNVLPGKRIWEVTQKQGI
jgi:hypothetical protein